MPPTREGLRELIAKNIPMTCTVEEVCADLAGIRPPTVEQIARALFDTDDEVKDYVRSRSDGHLRGDQPTGKMKISEYLIAAITSAKRFNDARDTCWRIDDKGFKTRAMKRAKAVVAVLGK